MKCLCFSDDRRFLTIEFYSRTLQETLTAARRYDKMRNKRNDKSVDSTVSVASTVSCLWLTLIQVTERSCVRCALLLKFIVALDSLLCRADPPLAVVVADKALRSTCKYQRYGYELFAVSSHWVSLHATHNHWLTCTLNFITSFSFLVFSALCERVRIVYHAIIADIMRSSWCACLQLFSVRMMQIYTDWIQNRVVYEIIVILDVFTASQK